MSRLVTPLPGVCRTIQEPATNPAAILDTIQISQTSPYKKILR